MMFKLCAAAAVGRGCKGLTLCGHINTLLKGCLSTRHTNPQPPGRRATGLSMLASATRPMSFTTVSHPTGASCGAWSWQPQRAACSTCARVCSGWLQAQLCSYLTTPLLQCRWVEQWNAWVQPQSDAARSGLRNGQGFCTKISQQVRHVGAAPLATCGTGGLLHSGP